MTVTEQRIVNGGFEDWPDPTVGWTAVASEDCLFLIWPYYHSGSWSAVMVSFVGVPYLTQDINFTNVNELSFWYDHYGIGFFVAIDDTLIDYYDAMGDWSQVTIDVSGYSGTHTLKFGLAFGSEDGDVFVFIDDVSAYSERTYWYDINTPKNVLGRRGNKTNRM